MPLGPVCTLISRSATKPRCRAERVGANNYVERTESQADRRSRDVKLTPAGVRAWNETSGADTVILPGRAPAKYRNRRCCLCRNVVEIGRALKASILRTASVQPKDTRERSKHSCRNARGRDSRLETMRPRVIETISIPTGDTSMTHPSSDCERSCAASRGMRLALRFGAAGRLAIRSALSSDAATDPRSATPNFGPMVQRAAACVLGDQAFYGRPNGVEMTFRICVRQRRCCQRARCTIVRIRRSRSRIVAASDERVAPDARRPRRSKT